MCLRTNVTEKCFAQSSRQNRPRKPRGGIGVQEACSTHKVNKKREQILAGKHQGKELTGRCSHRRNAVISR